MDDKKSFVENELKNALMKADSNIGNVGYVKDDTLAVELVAVWYKSDTYKIVSVAGDNEIAIMHDVAKRLLTD